MPLRSVFAGTFFLFFGFEVDPGTIPKALPAAVLLRPSAWLRSWDGMDRGSSRRHRPARPIRAGVALIARGEFSIVLAGIVVTAGAEPDLGPLAACYVLLLAICGPLLARIVDRRALPKVPAG